jgi:hypothetical protein
MSKEEIKLEINKILDHFSDRALEELLSYLQQLDAGKNYLLSDPGALHKILSEDKELLAKLAQ